MKKILLLFVFSILGCKSNKIQLETVELMGYYYLYDESAKNFKPDFFIYASIESSGFSNIIRKVDSNDFVGYSFNIDENLLRKIKNETYLKDEKHFEIRPSTEIVIDDGSIFRIKISFTDGKKISFIIPNEVIKKDSKYYIYKTLSQELIKSPITDSYNSKELNELKLRQKDFSVFAVYKDTLILPFPQAPLPPINIDEVKFIKPK